MIRKGNIFVGRADEKEVTYLLSFYGFACCLMMAAGMATGLSYVGTIRFALSCNVDYLMLL